MKSPFYVQIASREKDFSLNLCLIWSVWDVSMVPLEKSAFAEYGPLAKFQFDTNEEAVEAQTMMLAWLGKWAAFRSVGRGKDFIRDNNISLTEK